MTKILIVDDEPIARLRIRKLAEQTPLITAIEEATDGVDALSKIPDFEPDVVFLDIDMPEMTGFEVLQNLGEISFSVVFQTAYHQFAIKAFEVNACDYLLKPFTDERWAQALERALKAKQLRPPEISSLKEHLHKEGVYLTRVLIRSGTRNHVLRTHEISHFTSEEHITFAHTPERSFGYEQSLTFLEQNLDPKHFFRIHRNSIVNLDFVKTFTTANDGIVTLLNDTELHVSRKNRSRLKELLGHIQKD